MRVQIYIIAILSCLIVWGTSLQAAQSLYRHAHSSGLIPNLHIKQHVRAVLEVVV